AHRNCQASREAVARQNAMVRALFGTAFDDWWERAQAYQNRQPGENIKIEKFQLRFAPGPPDAVIELLDPALSQSDHPDMFPMRWELSFEAETGALVIDYELPSPESFPTLKAVRFDVLGDMFTQSHWSEAEIAQLYESAIYQTCLRSLHDVAEADE